MNPILNRHLYKSVHRSRFFWLMSIYLLGIGLLALIFAGFTSASDLVGGAGYISMRLLFTQGRTLYWFSSIILLLAAWLLAPISALGAISGEREHRTLELLRTTTLPARELVFGKMAAALMAGALYLLAPVPLLLSGYWIGDVTLVELGLTCLMLLVTMTTSTAWALYLSSRVKRTITAVLIYYGVAFGSLPLLGVVAALLIFLAALWVTSTTLAIQPLWIEALVQYGVILLSALHPITAGVATEVIWMEQGSWFWLSFTLERHNASTFKPLGTVSFPSPWILYTALSLLMTALLNRATIRQISRPER